MEVSKIRNIDIIAHVDHGKTTLVDKLLMAGKLFKEHETPGELIIDSNDLEKERGITILAKNVSVRYKDYKINVIDTPGHSDFGGEVERVLNMADGVLLLVDAFDGPMPQTRFVLQKALHEGLKPVVVVNKIDRPDSRPANVVNEVFDLLVDLGADDHALDFPVVFTSGKEGWGTRKLSEPTDDLKVLFETIIEQIPAPNPAEANPDAPLQMLVTTLDYSEYVGRIAIGRVFAGRIKANETVAVLHRKGN